MEHSVEPLAANVAVAATGDAIPRSVLLRLCGLAGIASRTTGRSDIMIGLVDGVPRRDHPCLQAAGITVLEPAQGTRDDAAAAHATFIASMLVGSGGRALGLCRNCRLLAVAAVDAPLLGGRIPVAALARRLADAVLAAVRAGAEVILLPLDILPGTERDWDALAKALAATACLGVRTVIPAGNESGPVSPILAAAGIVPVAAAGGWAAPRRWGGAIARSGVAAPGFLVQGAAPGGGYAVRSGSSFAAAFVVAAYALLRSLRPDIARAALWSALLDPTAPVRASGGIPALDAARGLARLHGSGV